MKYKAIFIYDVQGMLFEIQDMVQKSLERHALSGWYPLRDEQGNTLHALLEYWFKHSLYEMHYISFDGFGDVWRNSVPREIRAEIIRPVNMAESLVYRSIRVPLEFQMRIPRLVLRDTSLYLYYD